MASISLGGGRIVAKWNITAQAMNRTSLVSFIFRSEYSSGIQYLNGVVAGGNGEVYGVAGPGEVISKARCTS